MKPISGINLQDEQQDEQSSLTLETLNECRTYANSNAPSTVHKKRGLKSSSHALSMLLFFFAAGWSNSSLAQSPKPWCASGGGDWNCVTPIYGPWTFFAQVFNAFLGGFLTADAAYSALGTYVASFSATTGCPLTVGSLPELTSLDNASQEIAPVQVSWNDGGACINAGLNTVSGQTTAHVSGIRHFLGCPIGAGRDVDNVTWTDPSLVCRAPPTTQDVIKLSRLDGLAPESGTILFSNEPGQSGPELVATVYDNHDQLVPNVVVRLQANAIPNTGGHHHGDNSVTLRTGTLASADSSANLSQNAQVLSGNTGATGLVFTYNAPPVGGDNTIAATCIDNHHCTQQGPMQGRVGIKGLQPLGLNVYILIPNATRDPGHPDNHYLTPIAAGVVAVFANLYHAAYPDSSLLQLNDASLERGGIFDLNRNWKSPHSQHCRGTVVDIRANGADGALDITSDTDPMIGEIRQLGKIVGAIPRFEVPPDAGGVPVWDARHFHTRLMGQEGLQCP